MEKKPGRPIPGFSLNKQGERVDDESIIGQWRRLPVWLQEAYRRAKRNQWIADQPQEGIPTVTSNEHWEIDLKYGYMYGTKQFFYQMSVFD